MALMKKLNQFLQKRGEQWHYIRRVPKSYQDFDTRGTIRKSLKTDSLEIARKRRDELMKADEQYWLNIVRSAPGMKNTNIQQTYQKAKAIAMKHGFPYVAIDELNNHTTEDILNRLTVLEDIDHNIAPKETVNALLGTVSQPTTSLSQAFDIYCEQIAISDLIGKSEAQKKAWYKAKLRAISNFIEMHGEVAISEITRKQAIAFYNWWGERLLTKDGQKALAPNSANRDLGNLRKLYREYWNFRETKTVKTHFGIFVFPAEKAKMSRILRMIGYVSASYGQGCLKV